MRVRMKKGLSCALLLALLLSVLPGLNAPAWAEEIEELEPEPLAIVAVDDAPGGIEASYAKPNDESLPELDIAGGVIPDAEAGREELDENDLPPVEILPSNKTNETEDPAQNPVEPTAEKTDDDPAAAEKNVPSPAPVAVPAMLNAGGNDVRLYAGLAVEEDFRVSLYISLPADADPAQYRVKTVFDAQMSEQTVDRALSVDDKEDGLYVIPDIAAARIYQLTAPVDITVSRDGTVLRHEVYSVRDYLEALAADSSGKYVKFCVAALCYGGAAQRWLDGQSFKLEGVEYEYEVYSDDLADKDLTVPEPPYPLPAPVRPSRDAVYTGSITGFGNLAARFQIGLDTALRFYFSCAKSPDALTFSAEGYTFSEPAVQAPSFWYVDLTGIKAVELANDFVVNVSLDSQKLSALYSPYCYAAQHWNSSDAKLAELCRMMVAFGDEAAALTAAVKE